MSKCMMGFALLGALLLTAPVTFADYSRYAAVVSRWNGIKYDEGFEVVTLLTIGKNGEPGGTDGTIWWDNYGNDAWTVESDYRPLPSAQPGLGINYIGIELNEKYVEISRERLKCCLN